MGFEAPWIYFILAKKITTSKKLNFPELKHARIVLHFWSKCKKKTQNNSAENFQILYLAQKKKQMSNTYIDTQRNQMICYSIFFKCLISLSPPFFYILHIPQSCTLCGVGSLWIVVLRVGSWKKVTSSWLPTMTLISEISLGSKMSSWKSGKSQRVF